MKKIIYLSIFLGLVAGLATAALATVNLITEPIIEANEAEAFAAAVAEIFPAAAGNAIVAEGNEVESQFITQILEVYDSEGDVIGFIYSMRTGGFGGPVNFIVGIDVYGYFVRFTPLVHRETPGFGAQIEDDYWQDRFLPSAQHYAGEEINTISGASRTTIPIRIALREHLYYDFNQRRP
jgi:electron transport complex protein RnfG